MLAKVLNVCAYIVVDGRVYGGVSHPTREKAVQWVRDEFGIEPEVGL